MEMDRENTYRKIVNSIRIHLFGQGLFGLFGNSGVQAILT